MITDLLTSPQGHQFDPRMKILLAFCSARHPRRFRHDPGDRMTILSDMFVSFICENTHKVWYKNL